MAGPLSILNTHSHVPSHDNKTANLKAFFAHGFDIQTAVSDLLNKSVTHRFNIYIATKDKNYELWICIQTDFKKFETKYFDILDNST